MGVNEAMVPRYRAKNDTDIRRDTKAADLISGRKYDEVQAILAGKRSAELAEMMTASYLIEEITDAMFEQKTIDDERILMVIPKEAQSAILNIMCAGGSDSVSTLIERMLEVPSSNKDIQLLESFGIKKQRLEKLFYSSCSGSVDCFDVFLFMLKNDFFSKEEILLNLDLPLPIPFYTPEIKVDGLSVINRNKLANIPEDKKALDIDAKKAYLLNRFALLKVAVKEDYLTRLNVVIPNPNNDEKGILYQLKPKEGLKEE